jgi:hypothetical protein
MSNVTLKEPLRSGWRLMEHPSLGEVLAFREYVPAAEFQDSNPAPFDEQVAFFWGLCPRPRCGTINGCWACRPGQRHPEADEPCWWSVYLGEMDNAEPEERIYEIAPRGFHWWLDAKSTSRMSLLCRSWLVRGVRSGLGLEQRPGAFDEPLDEIEDPSEALGRGPTLAETYGDGKLGIHLHLRVRVGKGVADPQNLCAVIEPPHRVLEFSDPHTSGRDEIEVLLRRLQRKGHGWLRRSMLVRIGEVGEHGERRFVGAALCPIGLNRIDACPVLLGDAPEHPVADAWGSALTPAPVARSRRANGELVVPTRLPAAEDDQLPNEMVQRGPKVLDKIPEKQPPFGVRLSQDFQGADLDDLTARLCSGFALDLVDDLVRWWTRDETVDLLVQGVQMETCPLDLCQWTL